MDGNEGMDIAETNEILRALAHHSMSIAGFIGVSRMSSGAYKGRIYIDPVHIYNFVILPYQLEPAQWFIMLDNPRAGLDPANKGYYLAPLGIPRSPTPDPDMLAERKRSLVTTLPVLALLEPELLQRTEFYSILDFLGVPRELTQPDAVMDYLRSHCKTDFLDRSDEVWNEG